MDRIKVERYGNPSDVGYQGYIEPEDKSWIIYIGEDGKPLFYPHRATDGGVLCDGVGEHNVPRIERPAECASREFTKLLLEWECEAERGANAEDAGFGLACAVTEYLHKLGLVRLGKLTETALALIGRVPGGK